MEWIRLKCVYARSPLDRSTWWLPLWLEPPLPFHAPRSLGPGNGRLWSVFRPSVSLFGICHAERACVCMFTLTIYIFKWNTVRCGVCERLKFMQFYGFSFFLPTSDELQMLHTFSCIYGRIVMLFRERIVCQGIFGRKYTATIRCNRPILCDAQASNPTISDARWSVHSGLPIRWASEWDGRKCRLRLWWDTLAN